MNPLRFDFVLIGGGTAACAIARGLIDAEVGSVAIIEAGSASYGAKVSVPCLYLTAQATDWDWGWKTIPQKNLSGRVLAWPRGKMLGGSSGINASIYYRPSESDFATWPARWRSPSGIDQFQRHLRLVDRLLEIDLDRALPIHPLSEAFIDAVESVNCDQKFGPFAGRSKKHIRPVRYLRTQRNGRRYGAYHAMLRPIIERPNGSSTNLKVFESTVASNIEWKSNRAVRVRCENAGGNFELDVGKRLVICCGAVQTPAFMMINGIGKRDEITAAKIACRVSSEGIGENLQDHTIFPNIFACRTSSKRMSLERFDTRKSRLDYLERRSGPRASNLAEAGGFIGDTILSPPELQIHFTPTHYLNYSIDSDPVDAFTIGVTDCRPKSRGSITLNADRSIAIDPNYLAVEEDIQSIERGIELAQHIALAEPLKALNAGSILPKKLRHSLNDASRSHELKYDAKNNRRWISRFLMTLYHPLGTCAMGDNDLTPVDAEFRLRGTDNIDVIDASVIPDQLAGNPQALIMTLGLIYASIQRDQC